MVTAGTAVTEWKIFAISLPSRATQWMEAMPSMSSRGRTLSFPCLLVWTTFTWLPCCARASWFPQPAGGGIEPGERVGLFGFGSSASLAIAILQSWKCEVYVVTRGESHRKVAVSLGATWVGKEDEEPPVPLDRAVTFAPSGKVVVSALASLRKGGVVAINAIHLDQMPAFDYDELLWGERQIRSVANMTRQDARDFLKIAHDLNLRPQVTVFSLEDVNQALLSVKQETGDGSAVIVP